MSSERSVGSGIPQTNTLYALINNAINEFQNTPMRINIFNATVTAQMLVYKQDLETARHMIAVKTMGDPDAHGQRHISDDQILDTAGFLLLEANSQRQYLNSQRAGLSSRMPERIQEIESAIHYLTLSIREFNRHLYSRNSAYGGRKNKSRRKNKKSRKSRKSRKQ